MSIVKSKTGLWGMPWPLVIALAFMVGLAAGTWLGVLSTLKSAEEARERYKGPVVTCPAVLPPAINR